MKDISDSPLWCFDLDGTILEGSEDFYNRCFQSVITSFGLEINASQYPRGMNLENYLRLFWSHQLSENDQKAIMQAYRSVQKEIPFTARLYDDAVIFLEKHAAQQKVLVTNCSPATMHIVQQSIDLNQYFEYIFDRKPHLQPKPHPELYLMAAEHFGISPEHCIAFEDSITGIQSAQDASMHVIAVNRRNDLSPASLKNIQIISSFDEI